MFNCFTNGNLKNTVLMKVLFDDYVFASVFEVGVETISYFLPLSISE